MFGLSGVTPPTVRARYGQHVRVGLHRRRRRRDERCRERVQAPFAKGVHPAPREVRVGVNVVAYRALEVVGDEVVQVGGGDVVEGVVVVVVVVLLQHVLSFSFSLSRCPTQREVCE